MPCEEGDHDYVELYADAITQAMTELATEKGILDDIRNVFKTTTYSTEESVKIGDGHIATFGVPDVIENAGRGKPSTMPASLRMLYFFNKWESDFIKEDNSFLYNGDEASAAIFKQRMNGRSPKEFASAALSQRSFAYDSAKAECAEEELIPRMLTFWAQRVKLWRAEHGSKERARQAFEDRKHERETLNKLMAKGARQSPDGNWYLNPFWTKFGSKDHECAALSIPLLRGDKLDYRMRLIQPCHDECSPADRMELLFKKFFERSGKDLELLKIVANHAK